MLEKGEHFYKSHHIFYKTPHSFYKTAEIDHKRKVKYAKRVYSVYKSPPNLYEGIVVHDRKQLIEWKDHCGIPLYEMKQRTLAQDKMILGALKCAKANGYSGEE